MPSKISYGLIISRPPKFLKINPSTVLLLAYHNGTSAVVIFLANTLVINVNNDTELL